MKTQQLEEIHTSLVVGQRKQMVKQIDEYGLYDFFEDYKEYLHEIYQSKEYRYKDFTDCVISYHRIKNR